MSRYTPTYHAQSVYEIPPAFYKKIGVKNIIIDLDNTLDSYRSLSPSERAINLIASLKNAGFNVIIVTNNKKRRVEGYANELEVNFLYSARKPFAFKFNKLFEKHGLKKEETILIGDQLITDVRASKRVGIRSILTEKIVKEDQWTTHFNRLFDRPIRKKLAKQHKLRNWREDYE